MKCSRIGDVERAAHRMMRSGEIEGWLALTTILKARMELGPPALQVLPGGSPRG